MKVGKLEGPEATVESKRIYSANPKNSIQAKIISSGRDRNTKDEDLGIFWPLFPYDIMPVKEGEHVYVVFEDNRYKDVGLWLTRIPEMHSVDDRNLTEGYKAYLQEPLNETSDGAVRKEIQEVTGQETPIQISPDFTVEKVKKFVPRVGDRVIEGSNNTLIVLGRDRPSDRASRRKKRSWYY